LKHQIYIYDWNFCYPTRYIRPRIYTYMSYTSFSSLTAKPSIIIAILSVLEGQTVHKKEIFGRCQKYRAAQERRLQIYNYVSFVHPKRNKICQPRNRIELTKITGWAWSPGCSSSDDEMMHQMKFRFLVAFHPNHCLLTSFYRNLVSLLYC
jgi:hypothetical protein